MPQDYLLIKIYPVVILPYKIKNTIIENDYHQILFILDIYALNLKSNTNSYLNNK